MFGNSVLFTGNKGSSKTLHAVTELYTADKYKGRPLFVYGVKEFDCERFERETGSPASYLEKEQILNWKDHVPTNAVIFIDEVQKLWRSRSRTQSVPIGVQDIEDSRHSGIDFIATCQFIVQLDTHYRYLVDRHIHLESKAGGIGARRIKWLEWPKVKTNPDDYHAVQEAHVNKVVKIQDTYFGTYHSADTHYDSTKVPKRLYYILGLGVFSLAMIFYVVFSMFSTSDSSSSHTQSALDSAKSVLPSLPTLSSAPADSSTLLSSVDSYLQHLTPVVPDLPHTAPIYQELHVPVSMPRMQCLVALERKPAKCSCYTQQATKLNVSDRACFDFVKNGGTFDYTKEDFAYRPSQPLTTPYESQFPVEGQTPSIDLSTLRTQPRPSRPSY